jgi:hypothetical protein
VVEFVTVQGTEGREERQSGLVIRNAGGKKQHRIATGRTACARLKSINPGHALANDQCVDVVGAFVGFDGFQICHMAEDRVFVGHAVRTQYVA